MDDANPDVVPDAQDRIKNPDKTAAGDTMTEEPKNNRGFAAMDPEQRSKIAAMGGRATPPDKRSYSRDRELAAAAGHKGGHGVPDEKRSFSRDRELAARAGRKGGSVPRKAGSAV